MYPNKVLCSRNVNFQKIQFVEALYIEMNQECDQLKPSKIYLTTVGSRDKRQ